MKNNIRNFVAIAVALSATLALAALPSGYRELAYVESHGTEWFDTGVVPDAGTVCTVDVTPLNEVAQSRVVSARTVSYAGMCGYLYFEVYVNGYGKWACALKDDEGNWGQHGDTPLMRVGERVRLTLNADLATFTAGDLSSAIKDATRANRGQCAIQFMAQTKGTTDGDALRPAFVGRFHGATIVQDGVVVREFVPCRREADGAVGLYDIAINEDEPSYERFYANRGTGSLTVGTSLDVVDGKASVVFQPSTAPRTLYLAYGRTDGGDLTNGWEHVIAAANVPAGAGSADDIALPTGLDSTYSCVRAFLEFSDVGREMYLRTTRDYVQNGLFAQWDGMENAGYGVHNASAESPTELKGAALSNLTKTGKLPRIDAKSFAFGSGNLKFNAPALMNAVNAGNLTIEMVLAENGNFVHNGGLITIGSTTRGFYAYQQCNNGNNGMINAYAYHGAQSNYTVIGLLPRPTPGVHTCSFALGDSTDNSFYAKDGVRVGSVTRHTTDMTDDVCWIGQYQDSIGYRPTAKVYSIRLYTRKLSSEEIAANAAIDEIRFRAKPLDSSATWPRQLDVVQANPQAGTLDVRVPVKDYAQTLWFASDTQDVGGRMADWTNKVLVCTIPAGIGVTNGLVMPSAVRRRMNRAGGFRLFTLRAAKSYVQRGLYAQWDGIENAGYGVRNAVALWPMELKGADLKNYKGEGAAGMPAVDEKSFKFGDAYLSFESEALKTAINTGALTLEMVLAQNGNFVHNGGLVTLGQGSRGLWIYQQYNGAYNGMISGFCYHAKASGEFDSLGLSPLGTTGIHAYSFALGDSTANSSYAVNGVLGTKTITRFATDVGNGKCYLGCYDAGELKANAKVYSIRLYTEKLTAEELAANSAADYERFQCLQDVSSRFYETTPGGLAIIVR